MMKQCSLDRHEARRTAFPSRPGIMPAPFSPTQHSPASVSTMMTPVAAPSPSLTIWTVGHSTLEIDELFAVLDAQRIEAVADVRRYPGSRRLPQFQQDALSTALQGHGIAYWWIPALGGRRRVEPDSPNTGWRHPAFRGYADHLATQEFADGLFELLMLALGLRTAIMCAEVLWWRCHRRLISDVLTMLGVQVLHIRGLGTPEMHEIKSPALVVDGQLTYPGDDQLLADDHHGD